MNFRDKVVVVTGAGAGIGRATAEAFAAAGAKVAVVDVDARAGAEVVEAIASAAGPGSARFYGADVSDPLRVNDTVSAIVRDFGRVDVLVNNCGVYAKGTVTETTDETWRRILSVNVDGVFYFSRACAREMVKRQTGVIVNVASEAGLVGIPGQVAYNTSKAAVIGMTRSMAVDLARHGVRVNCVCPGTTETPLVRQALAREADPKAAREALERSRPANRLGRPEEIAFAIMVMAADEAAYATGSVLSIDGGLTAQ